MHSPLTKTELGSVAKSLLFFLDRQDFEREGRRLASELDSIGIAEAAYRAIDFNRRASAAGTPFHLHYVDYGGWELADDSDGHPAEDIGIPVTKSLKKGGMHSPLSRR